MYQLAMDAGIVVAHRFLERALVNDAYQMVLEGCIQELQSKTQDLQQVVATNFEMNHPKVAHLCAMMPTLQHFQKILLVVQHKHVIPQLVSAMFAKSPTAQYIIAEEAERACGYSMDFASCYSMDEL